MRIALPAVNHRSVAASHIHNRVALSTSGSVYVEVVPVGLCVGLSSLVLITLAVFILERGHTPTNITHKVTDAIYDHPTQ